MFNPVISQFQQNNLNPSKQRAGFTGSKMNADLRAQLQNRISELQNKLALAKKIFSMTKNSRNAKGMIRAAVQIESAKIELKEVKAQLACVNGTIDMVEIMAGNINKLV